MCVVLLAPQASAAPWLKSLTAAQKKAKEENQLIFVDMFAAWCGWCHKMDQEVFPSEAFQKTTDDMVLLRLNTEDGGEGTATARKLGVASLPTFVVLTHDMTIAGIIRGFMPAPEFVKTVAEVRAKYADFRKRVKQEPAFAKDHQKRLDLAREFTQRHAFNHSEPRLRKLLSEKGVPLAIRDASYYELAIAQFMQKKYVEAIATADGFSKVQKQGEVYERTRILVGQIHLEQGNLAAAATEFRNFKTSFPNSPHARTAEMYLPMLEARLKK